MTCSCLFLFFFFRKNKIWRVAKFAKYERLNKVLTLNLMSENIHYWCHRVCITLTVALSFYIPQNL